MEEFHEIVEQLPEEEESKFKKYLVMAGAIFLILLMLSYVLASPNVQDIIISLASSSTIEDGLVEQDITVQFEDDVYQELLKMYLENQKHEIKVCPLRGPGASSRPWTSPGTTTRLRSY